MAAELNIKPVHLSGHLHALWHSALEQQEDGDLSKWPNCFIAEKAMFDGDPDVFVAALKKHGWLDEKTNLLHDWLDYAGNYLLWKYRRRHREKLKPIWLKYGKRYGNRMGHLRDIHGTVSHKCPTQPTLVVGMVGNGSSSSKNKGSLRGKGKPSAYTLDFERAWKINGYGSKAKAWEAWKTAGCHALTDMQQLVFHGLAAEAEWRERAEKYKAEHDPGFFIPVWAHLSTWINQKRWEQTFRPIPEPRQRFMSARDEQNIREFLKN